MPARALQRTTKPPAIMKKLFANEVPQPPPDAELGVVMCFQLAARAFKHKVAERPTAAKLVPHAARSMRDLVD